MASEGVSGSDRSNNSSSSDRSAADSVSRETSSRMSEAVSGSSDRASRAATPADRAASQEKMETIGRTAQDRVARSQTAQPDQAATDAAQTAAKAVTGYRADMYGEIGVGNATVDLAGQRQFGGAVRESTLQQKTFTARQGSGGAPGFGIDDFARTDARGRFARSAAISSTATYNDAMARSSVPGGPKQKNIKFEVSREIPTDTRIDDMVIGQQHIVETKAAETVKTKQLAIDQASAANGKSIEYSITNNVETGAAGLKPSHQAKLNKAVANSGGNLSANYNPDIAPSKAAVETLETAAKVSRVGRALGKVAVPVGIAADTYAIGTAYAADGYQVGTNTKVATAEAAGGWAGAGAGAWGGAKAGAAIGTMVGGPIGTAVGAVAGGVVGAVGGALLGSGVLGKLAKGWFS